MQKTLTEVQENTKVKVIKIQGGREICANLLNMGIRINENILLISKTNGPIIIGKDNLRFAIGKDIAEKIIVEEIKDVR